MKSINKMAAVAVLALASAGVASAQTIHVTGSTAYRVADVSAEVAICGGASAKASYFQSTSLTGANYSIVTNSSGSLIFENFFNGSVAGDEALVDGVTTLNFPNGTDIAPQTVASVGNATTPAAGAPETTAGNGGVLPTASNYAYSFTAAKADISFSDVAFSTAQKIILASSDHTTVTPTGDLQVGIVPFVFVINASTDVSSSEITGLSMDSQKFAYTWSSGGAALLSLYTGNTADNGAIVYPLGRDVDSGTRSTALAETGYPFKAPGAGALTQPVAQYFPYASTSDVTGGDGGSGATSDIIGWGSTSAVPTFSGAASGTAIAAIGTVPAESIDGYGMPEGDGGYYSGGNLATALSTTNNDTALANGSNATVLVTYLGASDAKSALTASGTNRTAAKLMKYCGQTFDPTTNPAAGNSVSNLETGAYTFWSYEHLFYKDNNSIGSALATQANALKNALNGTGTLDEESSFGVTLTAMQVGRSGDGLNVQ